MLPQLIINHLRRTPTAAFKQLSMTVCTRTIMHQGYVGYVGYVGPGQNPRIRTRTRGYAHVPTNYVMSAPRAPQGGVVANQFAARAIGIRRFAVFVLALPAQVISQLCAELRLAQLGAPESCCSGARPPSCRGCGRAAPCAGRPSIALAPSPPPAAGRL